MSKSTVQRYLERLKAAGLSWPLPTELDEVALERRLFPPPPVASSEERCLPDCAAIHKEPKSRKNVTLQLLWEEYRQAHPQGYAYSWFRQLDLAPFDGLNWPHLRACDLLFRVGLGGRSPKGDWSQGQHGAALLAWLGDVRRAIRACAPPV
ncbi:MAG: hypothetical protein ACP5E5_15410 [Acidobacteriaceae bacterium]